MPERPLRGPVSRAWSRPALVAAVASCLACGGAAPAEPVQLDAQGVPVLPDEGGTKRITPQQVAYLTEKAVPYLLLDSRSRADYEAGRPAGAVSLPLDMTELAAARLPSDRLLITLCT